MSDKPDPPAVDYRDTVFLPKTDFPMKAGLAQKEPAILAKWEADDLYGQLRKKRAGAERFILHDGPPYANGDIHMGHALNKVLKDIVVRTKSLQGYDAPYVPGWDCHGLPIEWKVEEQYRKQKLNKDEVDPIAFRAECRAYAEKWVEVQRQQFKRLGVQGDWGDPYLTMNYGAEAAIVGELLKFAETGQLYRGAKPVMWSPVEKTALAEAEVEYEDIVSTQIDVAFEIIESPIPELVGAHAVIWTTTPWTIPVNQALAYGPEVEYVLLQCMWGFQPAEGTDSDAVSEHLRTTFPMLAQGKVLVEVDLFLDLKKRIEAELARHLSGFSVSSSMVFMDPVEVTLPSGMKVGGHNGFRGAELAGTFVRHPMHDLGGFFAKPRPMLPGDFVTTDAGTGLVHMSPDHGEDDFLLCKAHGIDPVFAVDGGGFYREDWAWLGGQGSVISPKLNAPDGPICSDLRAAGALLAASHDYQHSYPHSWRSKAKIVFRCTPQWFIPMDRERNSSPLVGEEGARAAAAAWEGEGLSAEREAVPRSPLPPIASRRAPPSPPRGEGSQEETLRTDRACRHRRHALGAHSLPQPHYRDGGRPARLGDLPPTRLGGADRALRPQADRRLSPRSGKSTRASLRRSPNMARTCG